MSSEIGAYYIQIMPSLRGAKKQIESQLSGVDTQGVGSKLGKQMTTGLSKGMSLQTVSAKLKSLGGQLSSVGASLTKSITVPALGAATALGGIVVAAGWKRLVGIDTAQAQLKGLGHDAASIETIMGSALASVKGTSYGLGDAATVAATAVAAGVKSGSQLTAYLTTVGDAAAVAGVSLSEMGSIFNKVQTAGRAYTAELNMLADRGIPIYQWLADAAGTSAEEVRKMAASGEISSEMFFSAVEKNIGGAAKIIGQESLTGAISNAWAAVGRLGAAFLDAGGKGGGFFSQLKPLIGEFTDGMDSLTDVAADLGVKAGQAFASLVGKARELWGVWQGLSPETKSLALKLAGVAVAAGPLLTVGGKILSVFGSLTGGLSKVVGWVGKLAPAFAGASGGAGGLLKVFTKFLGPVGLAISAIAALWTQSEAFRDGVMQVGQAIWAVVQQVWAAVQPVIEMVMSQLMPVITQVGDMIGELLTFIAPIIGEIGGLLAGIVAAAMPVVEWIIATLVPVFQKILTVVQEVFAAIQPVIQNAMTYIQNIIAAVMPILQGDWSAAWDAIKSALSAAWELIKSVVKAAIDSVKSVITGALSAISSVWSSIWGAISGVAASVWGAIKSVITGAINAVRSVITSVLGGIRSAWSNAWNTMRTLIGTVWAGIKSGVQAGINGVRSLISGVRGMITGFFSGAGSWLVGAGKAIIRGLVSGIRSMVGAVKDAVGGVLSAARNLLPFSPAKEGPFSGRGWTLYSGQSIVEALAQGVTQKKALFSSAVASTMAQGQAALHDLSAVGVGALSHAAPAASVFGGAGVTYYDNRNIYNPVAEPDSITVGRNLQKAASNVGGLV